MTLEKSVFGQKPNIDLLSQYIYIHQSNQRQGTAATKTRSQVSGGGRKPWKQKGTGRARHGSIRSPIWAHGGVAHGPKPKSWKLDLPKKMKKLSMVSALSQKYSEDCITVIDNISVEKPSTVKMIQLLDNLRLNDQKVLIVLNKLDKNIVKSTNNLQNVKTVTDLNLNPYDVLETKKVLFVKDSIKKIQEKYNESK
ncbi:50S ribosomal protein L4 [candidate division WWE3 bacterium RBG_19FT_COMBO_34_6]|uniref:Large ribosomal subunit protein uL4 n=1 Tax=candidate division WWE3 bacterium RBG_19FT_COMBO_34_6 TaxID=1802612 RepID=A0A1F4UK22_UNCKA|nr:MAG: 50S ribosomal protein L4 [candidate division WWE3 bacterium RBG_19FT_COMBO_34_6]